MQVAGIARVTALERLYAAGAVLWAAAVLIAPQTLAGQVGGAPLGPASRLVYAAGAVVCHQRPERSFMADGVPLPVCARCTGIYVAAALVAVALAGARALARSVVPYDRLSYAWRIALPSLAALPTIATVVYEWSTGAVPSNTVRFLAGAPIGAVVSWIAGPVPRPDRQSE